VNQTQFADAAALNRRRTWNSALTIIVICALSVGTMAMSLRGGQAVVDRVSATLAHANVPR
jgi:hypothetical protein